VGVRCYLSKRVNRRLRDFSPVWTTSSSTIISYLTPALTSVEIERLRIIEMPCRRQCHSLNSATVPGSIINEGNTSRRLSACNGDESSHSNKRKSAGNNDVDCSKLAKKTCHNMIEKLNKQNAALREGYYRTMQQWHSAWLYHQLYTLKITQEPKYHGFTPPRAKDIANAVYRHREGVLKILSQCPGPAYFILSRRPRLLLSRFVCTTSKRHRTRATSSKASCKPSHVDLRSCLSSARQSQACSPERSSGSTA
jgi:hypothetical protein